MELDVNTSVDAVDANIGDGICRTAGGECTLRAAIQETNVWPVADLITLGSEPSVVLSVAGTNEDAAASGDLDISGDLHIWFNLFGSGSSTIDGSALDRVFDVHSGTVKFERVVVTDGLDGGPGGAGIRTAAGSNVTLLESRVTANLVSLGGSGGGGGIRSLGTLVVDRSTIDANRAGTAGGGGILTVGATTITNSTITGNIATSGSGLRANGAAVVTITHSTISHNTSGAGIHVAGSVTAQSSIVSDHGSGNCSAALTSAGNNLDSGASCGFAGTGDTNGGGDPMLAPLARNDGRTENLLPVSGSPLLNKVPDNTGACSIPARPITIPNYWTLDQRLFARVGITRVEMDLPLFADADSFSGVPLPLGVHLPFAFVAKGRMCRTAGLARPGPERFAPRPFCHHECLGLAARTERARDGTHDAWETLHVGNTMFCRHSAASLAVLAAAVAAGRVARLIVPGEAL